MAQQILPLIDLTGRDRRFDRNVQATKSITETLGQMEKVRRERYKLDAITRAIGEGKTTAEAILAASREEPEPGTGIQGILQRLGGAFQPQGGIEQGIQRSIVGDALKRAMSPSLLTGEEQKKAARVKAGLEPRAAKPMQPFEQTPAGKARDRDVKILTDRDKDGNLKASTGSQTAARRRLRANTSLQDIQPGQIDFMKGLKDNTKEKVGKFDKAFGKKAYDEAIAELKDESLAAGLTEASVIADFNNWWDKKVEEERTDKFKEFVPRSEFQDVAAEGVLDQTSAQAILEEAGGDKEKAREIARQRGFKL